MKRYRRLANATLALAVDEDRRMTRLLCATVAMVMMSLGAASAQTYKMANYLVDGPE